MHFVFGFKIVLAAAAFTGADIYAQEVPGCGNLDMGYGPFDYTNPQHVSEYLPRVEKAHFEVEIQRLEDDDDAAGIGQNLRYVLGAFPNHHRGLDLMAQYFLQSGDKRPKGVAYSMECYFKRASFFRPEDGIVKMLFGNYLFKKDQLAEAKMQYDLALNLVPNHPELHYNVGLLYVSIGDYQAAGKHAERAYEMGFPLPGLRNKLEAVGYSPTVQD